MEAKRSRPLSVVSHNRKRSRPLSVVSHNRKPSEMVKGEESRDGKDEKEMADLLGRAPGGAGLAGGGVCSVGAVSLWGENPLLVRYVAAGGALAGGASGRAARQGGSVLQLAKRWRHEFLGRVSVLSLQPLFPFRRLCGQGGPDAADECSGSAEAGLGRFHLCSAVPELAAEAGEGGGMDSLGAVRPGRLWAVVLPKPDVAGCDGPVSAAAFGVWKAVPGKAPGLYRGPQRAAGAQFLFELHGGGLSPAGVCRLPAAGCSKGPAGKAGPAAGRFLPCQRLSHGTGLAARPCSNTPVLLGEWNCFPAFPAGCFPGSIPRCRCCFPRRFLPLLCPFFEAGAPGMPGGSAASWCCFC